VSSYIDTDKQGNLNCCAAPETSAPCCGGASETDARTETKKYVIGRIRTAAGVVPAVSTELSATDRIGTLRVRLGIGRMAYTVEPGLYAVGSPKSNSHVFVSANYKMSFDILRSHLAGRDAWILVLDTKGINVWCAAGKGTFGTNEIVKQVERTRLSEIVTHRRLVAPQLGAPGVSAHEVRDRCGFKVIYGPIRAGDISAFLDAGMKATPEMRQVRFSLPDRIVLIPVEFNSWLKAFLIVTAAFVILSGLIRGGYSLGRVIETGTVAAALCFAAYVAGTVLTPALLPWLPGRAFSTKGAWAGLALAASLAAFSFSHPSLLGNRITTAAWILLIPAISSFLGMNFTGASTFTSPSGVKHEMKAAVPAQGVFAGVGFILWVAGRFV